jgi:hypothetical protein
MIAAAGVLLLFAYSKFGIKIATVPFLPYPLAPTQTSLHQKDCTKRGPVATLI